MYVYILLLFVQSKITYQLYVYIACITQIYHFKIILCYLNYNKNDMYNYAQRKLLNEQNKKKIMLTNNILNNIND